MGTTPDIASLLRQRDLMNQLNQTTAQGTQADLLQPNLRAFDDTGGGTETTGTGVQQRRGGGMILSALTGIPPRGQRGQSAQAGSVNAPTAQNIPGLSQIAQAKQRLGAGITGLMTGQGTAGFKAPPRPTGTPVLQQNLPPGQPQLQPGQMLTQDANGNIVVAPNPNAIQNQPVQMDTPIQNPYQRNGQYDPSAIVSA